MNQTPDQAKPPKVETASLSLPKGGGAVRGIGEKFQVNGFTGTAGFSIPVPASPCRGSEPRLSLDYDSGSGNGPWGLGFSLGLASISRQTSQGIPRYGENDVFVISGAEDLVPESEIQIQEARIITYRPRIEGMFARIEQWIPAAGKSHWRVVDKDNHASFFGREDHARISDPENPERIFKWLLEETQDALGNRVEYHYRQEDDRNIPAAIYEDGRDHSANRYLETIKYGFDQAGPSACHFEIVFDYGEYNLDSANPNPYKSQWVWPCRRDSFSSYHAGFEIRTHRLCRNILMFHRFADHWPEPILVGALCLSYEETPELTSLASVTHVGYHYDKEKGLYETQALPGVELKYTPFAPQAPGCGFQSLLRADGAPMPDLDSAPDYQLVDLYGEGIPGVLYSDGASSLYFAAEGHGRYSRPKAPECFPTERSPQGAGRALLNITGQGTMDLLVYDAQGAGYYESRPDASWKPFQTLPAFPTEFLHPDHCLIDLTGNGLSDVVLMKDQGVEVYPSCGREGFARPEKPATDAGLPVQGENPREIRRFADVLGCGTPQWVRISDGRVECWPSLGYGKFGKKIQLANAPRFGRGLDTGRIFLADLDGYGPLSLIFAYSDRLEIYQNCSGNSFETEPRLIPWNSGANGQGIQYDFLDKIGFDDVMGRGTACLVVSRTHLKPQHWYFDFCPQGKPHLLCEIDNQLGAQTRITYSTSTEFYLEDKQKGSPWITHLGFPVHVVKRVENLDILSHCRLVEEYAYHHGCYDGAEREFRGFGMVERTDAQVFSGGLPAAAVVSEPGQGNAFPALVKTWYHTGAYQEAGVLSRQYTREYFQGDSRAPHLPDSVYESGNIAGESLCEAFRALKGSVLREEVYGLDGTDLSRNPYSAVEHNYTVRRLQPKGAHAYGVYLVTPRETMTFAYERVPEDPRVSHELVLKTDDFGHPLEACSLAYGRRGPDPKQPEDWTDEQAGIKATCTINQVINYIEKDAHNLEQIRFLGVPCQSRHYEIRNPDWERAAYLGFAEVETCVHKILEKLDPAALNLLSWERDYYWSAKNQGKLALGTLESPMLLCQTMAAVFSAERLEQEFQETMPAKELADWMGKQGKYFRLGADTEPDPEARQYWWNPGLQQTYYGPEKYYFPKATLDPWNHPTTYGYDQYNLMLKKVTDALGNAMEALDIDYQHLLACRVQDSNQVLSEILLDPLGRVIALSHQGKESGLSVGFKPLSEYHRKRAPSWKDAVQKPDEYLQHAAAYYCYDVKLECDPLDPERVVKPPLALNISAENYPGTGASERRYPITLVYSDGFGRELQSKQKVEPGDAFYEDEQGKVQTRSTHDRWLTSGRKVYNNKGNPVRQYEPFYFEGADYIDNPELNTFGATQVLTYDPLDRVVRIDKPKGKWLDQGLFTKTEWTPWHSKKHDENDTLKDSLYYREYYGQDPALKKAECFYGTPHETLFDNLGREVKDIELLISEDHPRQDPDRLVSHTEYDISGFVLSVADARLYPQGKKNFRTWYSLAGEPIKTWSADAGARWQLHDCLGALRYEFDSRKFAIFTEYDELHRPKSRRVRSKDPETPLDRIAEYFIYGDSPGEGPDTPSDSNLRGQVYQHFDQAGLTAFDAYTILGAVRSTRRWFNTDYKQEADWREVSPARQKQQLRDVDCPFCESWEYDALGRVVRHEDAGKNTHEPEYFISGKLEKMKAAAPGEKTPVEYIGKIEYDPRAQRSLVEFGNRSRTQYTYDPKTYELIHIQTWAGDVPRQDLNYAYDPVGNMTHLADGTFETLFHNQEKVSPDSDYTYDSLYRLIRANRRWHPDQCPQEDSSRRWDESRFVPLSAPRDDRKMQNCVQTYQYDGGGNLTRIRHQVQDTTACWTRDLPVAGDSNRLQEACYDAHGNLLCLEGGNPFSWNDRDMLEKAILVQREGGPDAEYYVYGANGQRVRKISERFDNAGKTQDVTETLYLGTCEIKRHWRDGNLQEEIHRLRILDGERCVAERLHWEKGEPPEGVKNPQVRYQLDNNIGSAVMELDEDGLLISYEEYFPFGGTAYFAGRSLPEVKLKAYRYSGKERDNTGLYYYGARYYAPGLGRWLSPDPAGFVDGLNLYAFVGGSPVAHKDVGGLCGGGKVTKKLRKARAIERQKEVFAQKGGSLKKARKAHQATIYVGAEEEIVLPNKHMSPERKLVRHLSTALLAQKDEMVEVQAAISHKDKTIYIASNKKQNDLTELLPASHKLQDLVVPDSSDYSGRIARHIQKLAGDIKTYGDYKIEQVGGLEDQHAETKIVDAKKEFDFIGGTRRPCLACAFHLLKEGVPLAKMNPHFGPLWMSYSAFLSLGADTKPLPVLKGKINFYVNRSAKTWKEKVDYDTDSESEAA